MELESDIRKSKKIFDIVRAKRDSALTSLEVEKKENVDLQSSIFKLSSTVTEQDKIIDAYKEEVCQLKEARSADKKGFQGLTMNFVQTIKSERKWILSLQHSNIDFTPIHKISLQDLSEVIQKEKVVNTVRES